MWLEQGLASQCKFVMGSGWPVKFKRLQVDAIIHNLTKVTPSSQC